jgi:putative nucleotidyltransferase with HDIG domain
MISNLGSGTPDTETCLGLAARFGMPEHIVRHSITVCGVALFIARRLREHGLILDADLIRSAALLHDVAKRFSIGRPLDHALTGAKILRKLGYHRTASIVRQHVRVSSSRPPGRVSEAEVVNYADKRVVEDRIATLEDRFVYLRRRYGRTPEALAALDNYYTLTRQLEMDVFALAPGDPSQILLIDAIEECFGNER